MDWYGVSLQQFHALGGRGLLTYYGGSIIRALRAIYPEHMWHEYKFSRPHQVVRGFSFYSKHQFLLYQYLTTIFRGVELLFNHKYAVRLGVTRAIEFDVSDE